MDNPIIIEAKKHVFIEAVKDACDALHLPMPEIDFSGKDDHGGNELAHCHPELYKICISERQLKLQNSTGLKETANHEMTHLIGMIEHGRKFEKVKHELMRAGWEPPKGSGVQFITGDIVNERSNKIRENPVSYAKVNEDSDLVKFLDSNESNRRAFEEDTRSKKTKFKNHRMAGSNRKVAGKGAKKSEKSHDKANYHRMTEAEIEESRKKLGIAHGKVSSNSSLDEMEICQKNGCNRKAVAKCKYCNKAFCEEHIEPALVISPKEMWGLNEVKYSDPEKYEKYNKDWNRDDGHPCPEYTEFWNRQHEIELKKKYEEMIHTKFKKQPVNAIIEPSNYISRRSFGFLYEPWMVKESLILAIIVTFLAALPIGLVYFGNFPFGVSLFSSNMFIWDFIVLFVIAAIYGKIASGKAHLWEAFTIASFMAIVAITTFGFGKIDNIGNFILSIVLLFIVCYVALIIGRKAGTRGRNRISNGISIFIRIILIVFLIIMLSGFAFGIQKYLVTYSNLSSINNGISNVTSALNKIANTTGSIITSQQQINSAWVSNFFANVSVQRGMPYRYCQNLSTFAKLRFNTMVSDYGISHYGYDQDFNNTYGGVYNTYFAEEVFYPSGSPSNFVNQIEATAPLHWQLLVNETFVYYGYYVHNGPTYVIYGPDNGYQPCPVTEIPGPNINIPQYFAQYGCSVAVENETWFVIEIASACP